MNGYLFNIKSAIYNRKSAICGGFTLIELLIVIAIIAIIAAVIFVALNPLKRFQDSRDAVRASDITSIADAIKLDQVDNGGSYVDDVANMGAGNTYMIVDGAMDAGCDDNNSYCDTNVLSDVTCVDLSDLVTEGYLGDLPISPSSGNVTWDDGDVDGDEGTGYTLTRTTSDAIIVRSCESEGTTEIEVTR